MREVIILAAGEGLKFWPYQSTRNKCMFPIVNKPLLAHTVETCLEAGIEHIIIVSKHIRIPFDPILRQLNKLKSLN